MPSPLRRYRWLPPGGFVNDGLIRGANHVQHVMARGFAARLLVATPVGQQQMAQGWCERHCASVSAVEACLTRQRPSPICTTHRDMFSSRRYDCHTKCTRWGPPGVFRMTDSRQPLLPPLPFLRCCPCHCTRHSTGGTGISRQAQSTVLTHINNVGCLPCTRKLWSWCSLNRQTDS